MASGVALVLAVTAMALLVVTDDVKVLRLAVVMTLWAFLLALVVSMRRRGEETPGCELELRRAYEVELEREVAARREYELRLEVQLRRELDETRQKGIEALRHDLLALHRQILDGLDGVPPSRPVRIHAESTRVAAGHTGGWPADERRGRSGRLPIGAATGTPPRIALRWLPSLPGGASPASGPSGLPVFVAGDPAGGTAGATTPAPTAPWEVSVDGQASLRAPADRSTGPVAVDEPSDEASVAPAAVDPAARDAHRTGGDTVHCPLHGGVHGGVHGAAAQDTVGDASIAIGEAAAAIPAAADTVAHPDVWPDEPLSRHILAGTNADISGYERREDGEVSDETRGSEVPAAREDAAVPSLTAQPVDAPSEQSTDETPPPAGLDSAEAQSLRGRHYRNDDDTGQFSRILANAAAPDASAEVQPRRRRYREDDEENEVLARVLGR